MKQQILDILPTAAPSLFNFIPGNNLELIATLKNALQRKEKERFFYIWGNTGCGKSHLLQSVVHYHIGRERPAQYCPGALPAAFELNESTACVAIDDVERLSANEQVRLFNIYNRLREHDATLLVVSGPVAPAQLPLRQDLVTRLGWGLVFQVHDLTENEKIEALQKHALTRGFTLELSLCQYLLRHSQRDLPSLIMLVDELDRYSLIHQRKITLPLLRKLLQEN